MTEEIKRDETEPPACGSLMATAPPFAVRGGKRRLHFLLVEDNFFIQRLIADSLQSYGHAVSIAGNGREAIERWRDKGSDIILMDMQMPGMSGLKAMEEIRAIERSSSGHTPIIAITATPLQEEWERCLAAGADEYLAKPINVGELLERFHGSIPDFLPAMATTAAEARGPGPDLHAYFHVEAMPVVMRQNRHRFEEYICLLLRDMRREVFRMEQAVRDKNRQELNKAAHSIRGAAVHLKNGQIGQLAIELEEMDSTAMPDSALQKLALLKVEFEKLAMLLPP